MSEANPYDAPQIDTSTTPTRTEPKGVLRIRRIDPSSAGLMMGGLYALFGIVVGGFMSIAAVVASMQGEMVAGLVGGVFAIVLFPLLYGVLGLIVGALAAFFYNLVAGAVGGVKLSVG